MGIGVNGRFGGIINNPREMNNLVAKGLNIENGQTVKESAAFPEEKPDVDKTHYNSKDEFNNALKDGKIKDGDTYSDGKDTYLVHVTNDGQIKTEKLKPRTFRIFS